MDEIEIDSYWTNLGESPADIIDLYHDHGTSERFPSASYATNKLILALGGIAYNLLRGLGQRVLALKDQWPKHLKKRGAKLQRRRVGSIMRDLINIASKVVTHAGQTVTKIASGWPWSRVILSIARQLN